MRKVLLGSVLALGVTAAFAGMHNHNEMHAHDSEHSFSIEMMDLSAGQSVGQINVMQSEFGVVFMPQLANIDTQMAAVHGFHVHENPSCEATTKDGKTTLGGAAGGHYDPDNTGKHGMPWTTDNHLGDLPALFIDGDGNATQPVLAPRLELDDLKGRALMVHVGGDNHSDHPNKLGGGGARMLCGVISMPE